MRFRHKFSSGLVLAMFLPVWMAMYWLIWDTNSPVTQVTQTPAPSELVTVERPDGISIERVVCLSRPVWGTVSASFVDGVIYHIPSFDVRFNAGCTSYAGVLQVPHSLPAGAYHYRVSIDFKVNPLATAHVTLPDIAMDVHGAPEPAAGGVTDSAFPHH